MSSQSLYTQRTSIHGKVLRQSVLLVSFCILLLGGLAFFQITSFWAIALDPIDAFHDVRSLAFSVLLLSGLLVVLAVFLSNLLAGNLTGPLRELALKVHSLKPGTWTFRRTIMTGDEVETLDRVVDDLTHRLRDTYEHLEDKVAERTRQLREESALDHAILKSIEYGIIAMDREGNITEANPAACFLLGHKRDQLLGSSAASMIPLAERHDQAREHPVQMVIQKKASWHSHPSMHLCLQKNDDTALPISLLVVPLVTEKQLFGAIAVIQDQTLERQVDYMKSEFISLASHQLRTPLSSMRWYIEMLNQEKSCSEEQRTYIQEIDVASKRMANLIDALLHVAKLEDGGLVVEKQQTDLTPFFRRLIDNWMESSKEQGIPLTTALPEQLPFLTTDQILLEIVLQNLLTNAFKYSPTKKPITFCVTIQNDFLRISVRDQGIGIPAADRKRLFQKFFRAKNVREIDTDGTGLGLYMSKTIIENLGGSISFVSEEGKGSEFMVVLPL